jgi:hypothetical protein
MGAVITFPQAQRRFREMPTRMAAVSAAVIILPVVRIERANNAPAATENGTKSPPGRKRRKRTAPTLPSPASGGG